MTLLVFLLVVVLPVAVFWASSLKQINEYERGVVYTFGRCTGIMMPGWRFMWPYFQQVTKVDIRTKTVEVQKQEAITKDNIQAKIAAVVYYKITDPMKVVNEVEDYVYAVAQLAQTSMRNVIGGVTLNELLSEQVEIAERVQKEIDRITEGWGVDLQAVEIKDIELPESMIRTMAKRAEAEREKEATIIVSEGEVLAAENLSKAAELMASHAGALHLRTLKALDDVSSNQNTTIIMGVPVEMLRAMEAIGKLTKPM